MVIAGSAIHKECFSLLNHNGIARIGSRIGSMPQPLGGHDLANQHPNTDERPAENSVKPLQ